MAMRVLPLTLLVCLAASVPSASSVLAQPSTAPTTKAITPQTASMLATARKGFLTKLRPLVSAPGNPGGENATPPNDAYELVPYRSSVGPLPAYLSPDPKDGQKHPAVLWCKPGNGPLTDIWTPRPATDDSTPRALREAGIVVMAPLFRGQGNNPAQYSMFYYECDDALAALDHLAALPYVDPSRIYIAGVDTGGTMALLVSQLTGRFRAAFSLGGCPDMEVAVDRIVKDKQADQLPFDYRNAREIQVRSPLAFAQSLKTPTWYFEADTDASPSPWASAALQMGVKTIPVKAPFHAFILRGADRAGIVNPVTTLLANKIRTDTGDTCDIGVTTDEIQSTWKTAFPNAPDLEFITPVIPQITVAPDMPRAVLQIAHQEQVDMSRLAILVERQKGQDVTVGFAKLPLHGYVAIPAGGITIGVEYRMLDTLKPSYVDMQFTPQRTVQIVLRRR
jgi:dienelactone hydrolase